MNISSVVPSIDTATETMTDFEKVDRVRKLGWYLPIPASKWGIHAIVLKVNRRLNDELLFVGLRKPHERNGVLWTLSQQLLYTNKRIDFVCFSQFLGPSLLKALKFQDLVNDSVYRRRRDTGFPNDLTYGLVSSRRIILADASSSTSSMLSLVQTVRFLPDFLCAECRPRSVNLPQKSVQCWTRPVLVRKFLQQLPSTVTLTLPGVCLKTSISTLCPL